MLYIIRIDVCILASLCKHNCISEAGGNLRILWCLNNTALYYILLDVYGTSTICRTFTGECSIILAEPRSAGAVPPILVQVSKISAVTAVGACHVAAVI